MSKIEKVRAVTEKALAHLSDEERKLVREAAKDLGRIMDLTATIAETPVTAQGMDRIVRLHEEIQAIHKTWTHD